MATTEKQSAISNSTASLRLRNACVTRLLPLLLLLALPAVVQAQFFCTTNNGSITITDYLGSGGAVTIPNTINGLPVTKIEYNAFNHCTSLTSLTIGTSVTQIAAGAFSGCTNLTSVIIPKSAILPTPAFSGCSRLETITVDPLNPIYKSEDGVLFNKNETKLLKYPEGKAGAYVIPSSVTSIESGAFSGSANLTSISIPSSVTNVGSTTFYGCSRLIAILVGPLNSTYSSVDGVLFNKSQTVLMSYPDGKAGSYAIPTTVANIGSGAFSSCSGLTSVTIPTSVTSIGDWAFEYCTGLPSITIPNNVTNIGASAFASCSRLGAITMEPLNSFYCSVDRVLFNKCQTVLTQYPGGKAGSYAIPSSVTSIEGAFSGCTGLTDVTIPSSIKNLNGAFKGCASLTNIIIPNSVTDIGGAFAGCTSLASVTIPNSVTSIAGAFGGCTSLANLKIPNSITKIGSSDFLDCISLTNVTIGNLVTNMGYGGPIFYTCTSLTSITVDASNASFSSMDGVLYNKKKTTLIECPAGKTGSYTIPDSVTSFWGAFDGGGKLTSIAIGTGVTNIDSFAFGRCTSLAEINVNAANPFYSSMDGVLFDKRQATLLEYPVNKSDGSYIIADSVTKIGSYAFQERNRLTSIKIPNSVTNIGAWAFFRCTNLTSITMGNGVTGIGSWVFSGCASLTNITIPKSVTLVGNDAFACCARLTGAYFKGNAPSPGLSVFGDDNNAMVYYLPGTTGWGSTFGGRPTALWNLPVLPQMQTSDASFGVRTNQFGFTITGLNGLVIVVEVCTDIVNPSWLPLQTNTLTGGSSYCSDPQWTNYPTRFYRLRSP